MLERDIEQRLRSRVRALGGKAYKWVSPGNSGVPDRIVLMPGGKVYLVELKAPGQRPRPLQEACHRELARFGQHVFVLDSYEAVEGFLETAKGGDAR